MKDSDKTKKQLINELVGLRRQVAELDVLKAEIMRIRETALFSEEKLLESNRRLEETLNEMQVTQHRIIQQERLSALGQLASGIAHDFNNTLTPILGYSDMLLETPYLIQDEKAVYKYIEQINIAAMDARDTVNRLREFYRNREEDEFTLIDLNELIQQAIQLTKMKWKDQAQANGITINILTDLQEIPSVNGIEAGLQGVLANLIINSVDAMLVDGTISLRTRFMGANVVLEVSDTGVGMTEEVKKRCFEPFFSTKGLNGTGLGLSLVQDIIRRHEGKINIESEAGKGTTFIIYLPIPTEIKYKEKAQEVELSLQPLHILVVEDEPLIQEMIGKFLTIDGHTFETARNGREGLEKFKANTFDLVITDWAMPEIGGDQLAKQIKKSAPKIPIIMVTGFVNAMKASSKMQKNIDILLGKPITLKKFRSSLNEVCLNRIDKR
jgi:signal transduction histidine kinase